MIKAVLDTNTLISAIGWRKGNPRKVLELAIKEKFHLITSKDLMQEFYTVINRDKFSFLSKEEKSEFLVFFAQIAEVVEPSNKLNVVKDDPKDDIVLEAALEGKADYIVSGDNHLLKIKEYKNIKMVTPQEFLDII